MTVMPGQARCSWIRHLFIVEQVFSIVVFSCIASIPDVHSLCPYYFSEPACNLGIAVGVLSFLGLMVFLVTDALFDNLSNIQHRKYIVVADISFSCIWAFMWLMSFSYLTSKWRRVDRHYVVYRLHWSHSTAVIEAPLAFAFFCLLIYIALAVLAIIKLRRGVEDRTLSATPAYGESHITVPPSVAGYNEHDSQFSPHPFGSTTSRPPNTTSEPPSY